MPNHPAVTSLNTHETSQTYAWRHSLLGEHGSAVLAPLLLRGQAVEDAEGEAEEGAADAAASHSLVKDSDLKQNGETGLALASHVTTVDQSATAILEWSE